MPIPKGKREGCSIEKLAPNRPDLSKDLIHIFPRMLLDYTANFFKPLD